MIGQADPWPSPPLPTAEAAELPKRGPDGPSVLWTSLDAEKVRLSEEVRQADAHIPLPLTVCEVRSRLLHLSEPQVGWMLHPYFAMMSSLGSWTCGSIELQS